MLDKQISEIELANKFDISAPATEEEFESSLDRLAAMLLFGTRWEAKLADSPRHRRNLPILGAIPLVCKGSECMFADVCEVLAKHPEPELLVGTRCRVEKDLILRSFTGWVHELDISPTATTDILNVASLVRLEILLHRIDWRMAICGFMDKIPVFNSKTGAVHHIYQPTQLLKYSDDINKQIKSIQGQLMASRKDRSNLVSDKVNDFMSLVLQRKSNQESSLDAEFTESDNL